MKIINEKQLWGISITRFRIWKSFYVTLLIGSFMACDDFVEVDQPNNLLTSELVFEDVATINAVLRGIYADLRDGSLSDDLSVQLGLYTDELDYFNTQNTLFDHTIIASDGTVFSWWGGAYNLIYVANAVLESVENSTFITQENQDQFRGEALFIRGYVYSLLVELFGPVPYITNTNYIANTIVSRNDVNEVYDNIIKDLEEALELLDNDISGERIRPYKAVVEALLARVNLYAENWQDAEDMASNVIDSGVFALESNMDEVFLKEASGTIWQFIPPSVGENTSNAETFILFAKPTNVALYESFIDEFEFGDQRLASWVGSITDDGNTYYYAFKYKEKGITSISSGSNEDLISFEYPVVFRLAEQYLIRAEARAELNKIAGAQSDLNVVRNRAGLRNTMSSTTQELLDAILRERRVELFTEYGHRWFDLKRWFTLERPENAAEVLTPLKPNWKDTNVLFPVPESEILLNPNLLPQNDGYQ
ncbi:RagB/SusD family nutrient uptake outer membrane protein [Polaribacter vadi]|nr:RagB/SusD family nutrient uptake outer membrane protein [Polaribacter vadi]